MDNVIQSIISALLLFPFIVFILVFILVFKFIRKPLRSFGVAADTTTIFLFLSVPIAIEALFEVKTLVYILCITLLISVIITIQEWKKKKEIEYIPLLRKIWRFLFLCLSICYLLVLCLGLILKIIHYVN
jgi:hypothetical protein